MISNAIKAFGKFDKAIETPRDSQSAGEKTVGEKAKVKETVRLYSRLWKLPSFRGIVGRLILYVAMSSLILSVDGHIIGRGEWWILFIQYLLEFATPAILGTLLLFAVVRERGSPLDLRRTSGVMQYALMTWLAVTVIGSILDLATHGIYFEVRMMLIGVDAYFLSASFLVTALSRYHPIRNFIATLMPILSWLGILWVITGMGPSIPTLPENGWLYFLITLPIIALAVHNIFRSVSMPFERDLGINGPALLRGFGYEYLCDNPEPFEQLMAEIAHTQDIPIDVCVFQKDNRPIGVIVNLYIHPGPFKTIGSSTLPSAVMKHVREKYGVPTFVTHGTCTHHQNLITQKDFPKVFAEIDQLIEKAQGYESASGPHFVDGDRFKAWTFFVNDKVMVLTTSAPHFTDDIALEVGRQAMAKINDELPQFSGVSIADCHNCIDDDAVSVMPGDPEADEYVGTVLNAIKQTKDRPMGRISIGIAQETTTGITRKEGIGPGGITALVVQTNTGLTALISIDGNNMEPGMREETQQALINAGFSAAEVMTTDTHIVNAISLSSKGYPPVGRYQRDAIIIKVVEIAKRAWEQLAPVKAGFEFGTVKELRTYGEKGFDILTKDIAEAAGIAKRVGVRSSGIALLIAVIIAGLI